MSDIFPREGSQLGPYQLDKLHPESNLIQQGRVYVAHHVDTGAPAMVFVPDASHPWVPRLSWAVRAKHGDSPAFSVVEVEPTPGVPCKPLEELTRIQDRLSAAMAIADESEETSLFPERRPRTFFSMTFHPVKLLSLVVLGVLLLETTVVAVTWRLALRYGAGGPLSAASAIWGDTLGPSGISFPMPPDAFLGQQGPPCVASVEFNGGCWALLDQRAPCPKGYAEHEGRCYIAISESAPKP